MNGNRPLLPGFGPKPAGANFYPPDMSVEEFERLKDSQKAGLYSLIRRDKRDSLVVVPYHEAFHDQVSSASALIQQASLLADDPGLKKYLELRSKALLDDNYLESDLAWMDMTSNTLDFVVGPVETYEDQLFGYKAVT